MKTLISITIFGFILGLIGACNSNPDVSTSMLNARPGVTLSSPVTGSISDSVDLTAHVRLLNKNTISAPFNGYIKEIMIQPGDAVKKGQLLLQLDSKEARALAEVTSNTMDQLGSIFLKASSEGQLATLSHYVGDFVREGEVLAEIVKPGESYLEIYVPFRYRSFIHKEQQISVQLPGHPGAPTTAVIQRLMGNADVPSQTVIYLAKLESPEVLPEGLILTSRLQTETHENTQIIPKEVVLANEELTSFWVMQMMNDSLAVKVPIQPGISTANKIEVLAPHFDPHTRIIRTGQYGLEDSTLVRIQEL